MPSLLPQLREVGHAPLRGAADAGGGPAGSGAVRQQDEGQVSASLRGLPPEPSVRQHGASQPLQAGPQEAGRGLPRDLTQEAGRGLPGTSPRLAAWCPVSRLLWAGAEGLRRGVPAGRCGGGGPSTWRARPRWTRRCTATSWPRTTSPWSASTASRATSSGWVPRPTRLGRAGGHGVGVPREGAGCSGGRGRGPTAAGRAGREATVPGVCRPPR